MKYLVAVLMTCLMDMANAQDVSKVMRASGTIIRALDTTNGHLKDIEILNGQTQVFERLEITATECKYPVDNPASDAFAYLMIYEAEKDKTWFEGWMTAASPGLSAMDHPRYDVWVLRCNMPEAETSDDG